MKTYLQQCLRTSRTINQLLAVGLLLVVGISTPARAESIQEQKNAAANKTEKSSAPNSHFTTLDGTKIHYVDYGKGDDALVLIHGWTMNVDNWRDQIPDLAKQYRVIAVDLPGHGKSDKPEGTYSMEYFARAVDAAMQDARVKRGVLVGHSMGTPVARQFYRKYPAKTLGVVAVDGVLAPLADKATMERMMAGFRAPNYRDTVAQMLAQMYGPNLSTEAQDRIKTSAMSTPQYVLVSAMEGMADPAIWGDDKINLPVLAIMAKNPFFPPNIEEITRRKAPQLEFYMWDGVGHFLMMEKPKEFNQAVITFVDKNKLLKG